MIDLGNEIDTSAFGQTYPESDSVRLTDRPLIKATIDVSHRSRGVLPAARQVGQQTTLHAKAD